MKTKLFIVLSLMAFIFIGCDKDDEKVLPEEQEPEQKQNDEEEMQHNGVYVFKWKLKNPDGINYFNIDHSNLEPGFAWYSPNHFCARIYTFNHFPLRYKPCLDMNSYAKIDGSTIISGDERYVLADEEGRNFTTWATGEWLNKANYIMNQNRDKDTTNVWCGLTYCENNGDPYFVFGMLNPDSLVGKYIALEIYVPNQPVHSGAVETFVFERFTYKPNSNNLDSVYITSGSEAFYPRRTIIPGYPANTMFTITFDVKDTTEQWYYTKQRIKPQL